MKHIFHTCDDPACAICEGGMDYCEVCHSGSVCLPSECPGVPMTEDQRNRVFAKTLDFKNGIWFNPLYKGFVGTWTALPPGYGFQFETTMQRVMGAIWFADDLWNAQRYRGKVGLFKFKERRDAELYIKAADDDSVAIAIEARHE